MPIVDPHSIPTQFNGWAVVEMFGHVKEVGYVTTEAYGTAVLFRVDTPELPEREYTLEKPEYASANPTEGTRWCPVGTKVKREACPAKTRLVGPGAIYSITPCSPQTAIRAIEELIRRPLILLELPAQSNVLELPKPVERCCEGCGYNTSEGHEPGSIFEDTETNDEESS